MFGYGWSALEPDPTVTEFRQVLTDNLTLPAGCEVKRLACAFCDQREDRISLTDKPPESLMLDRKREWYRARLLAVRMWLDRHRGCEERARDEQIKRRIRG